MCWPCNGAKAKEEQKELNRRLHAQGRHPNQIAAKKRQLEKELERLTGSEDLETRAMKLRDSENSLLLLIENGGVPTGNLGAFTHRAEHGLFSSKEVWLRIMVVLMEERGYNPEGVVYGSKAAGLQTTEEEIEATATIGAGPGYIQTGREPLLLAFKPGSEEEHMYHKQFGGERHVHELNR